MLMGTEKEIEPKRTSNTEPSVAGKPAERRERFWDLKASHWVSVFLTIVLIGVGYLQYRVYNQQYTIMEIDQRPWITITGMSADWPIKDKRGTLFQRIDTQLKNYGKSTAHTLLDGTLLINPDNVWKRQPQICQDVRARAERGDWQLKWALFPTAKSPYAIQKKYIEDPVSGPYTPWVVGCIAYQSTADKNDPVHTTPFAAYLSVEDPANVIDDAAPNPIDPNAVGPPLSKSLVGKSVGATGGD